MESCADNALWSLLLQWAYNLLRLGIGNPEDLAAGLLSIFRIAGA